MAMSELRVLWARIVKHLATKRHIVDAMAGRSMAVGDVFDSSIVADGLLPIIKEHVAERDETIRRLREALEWAWANGSFPWSTATGGDGVGDAVNKDTRDHRTEASALLDSTAKGGSDGNLPNQQ